MKTIIQKDFYRESGKWLSHFQILKKCFSPNLHYIYWFRNAQKYSKSSFLGKIYRIILRHYQIKYGFQIYPETEIGEGFYLGHWGALVINPKVKIGKNCNIAQGVTIGQANRGERIGVPEIGDEVWIGTNVLIAPNAYVNTDVPSNSIVIGNPAQITPNEKATNGYINNKI